MERPETGESAEERRPALEENGWNLRRLQWLTIVLPVFFLGMVFLFWRLVLAPSLVHLSAEFLTFALVVVGVFIFSQAVFNVLRKMQRDILQRNQELSALNAVAAAASGFLGLNEVMTAALDKVLEVMEMEVGAIWLLEEHAGEMVLALYRGSPPESLYLRTKFKIGDGLPGRVAQSGEPITSQDSTAEPLYGGKWAREQGVQLFACVPLKVKGKVVGAIDVASRRHLKPTPRDLELLTSIANQTGVAIENAKLYQQVRELAVLEERDRIAREMHDGLAQVLGYLNLKIDSLEQFVPPDQAAQRELQMIRKSIGGAYADVREAIVGLRASAGHEAGLIPSLEQYLNQWGEQSGIETGLTVKGDRMATFDLAVEIQLTRIIQEALANVRKHAQARRAWIRFHLKDSTIQVAIEDNGCGFDPSNIPRLGGQHFGLFIMRERVESIGGSLEIESKPGQGTKILVNLPATQQKGERNGTHTTAFGR